MIQNVLRHMGGIEGYGIASVCLFFACFFGVLLWAIRLRKPHLEQMAALPLDSDFDTDTDTDTGIPQTLKEHSDE